MSTNTKPRFTNIADIKRAHAEAGMFWFSPDTIRYFASRVESRIYDGGHSRDHIEGTRVWVESTKNYDDTAREYKLARFDVATGDISYVSAQRFRTKAAAVQALEGLL